GSLAQPPPGGAGSVPAAVGGRGGAAREDPDQAVNASESRPASQPIAGAAPRMGHSYNVHLVGSRNLVVQDVRIARRPHPPERPSVHRPLIWPTGDPLYGPVHGINKALERLRASPAVPSAGGLKFTHGQAMIAHRYGRHDRDYSMRLTSDQGMAADGSRSSSAARRSSSA